VHSSQKARFSPGADGKILPRRRFRAATRRSTATGKPRLTTLCGVKLAAEIVVVILVFAVPLVVVGVLFVWAARKDGEEDRALQRRLGIRRRTRLGR
jgi:hypothetical protein